MYGEGPVVGHTISHAHMLAKRRCLPSLVSMRALVGRKITRVRVCTRCLKARKVTKAFKHKHNREGSRASQGASEVEDGDEEEESVRAT